MIETVTLERDKTGQWKAYGLGCTSDPQATIDAALVSLAAAINGKSAMKRPAVRLAEAE